MNKLQKTFNDIVERTRAKPIGTAGSFSGLCPSHDDNSASMSITMEIDRILLYCHAGCTIDNICLSLEIEQPDLFASRDKTQINKVPIPLKLVKEQKRMKADINADSKVVFFSSKHQKKVTESVRYSYINVVATNPMAIALSTSFSPSSNSICFESFTPCSSSGSL